MVQVHLHKEGDRECFFGYRIIGTENGDVVDFTFNEYSNINKWKKEKVLTKSITYRRNFKDILDYLGTTREGFEKYLEENFEYDMAVQDAILETQGNEFYLMLPTRYTTRNGKSQTVFKTYNDSKNEVNVFVNKKDYSHLFDDFDIFDDKAVDKAYELLVSGRFIKLDSDISKLEKEFKEILSSVVGIEFFLEE